MKNSDPSTAAASAPTPTPLLWTTSHHGFDGETPVYAVVRGSEVLAADLTLEKAESIAVAMNIRAALEAENARLRAVLVAMREDYETLARNHADAWHNSEVLRHQTVNAQARAALKGVSA